MSDRQPSDYSGSITACTSSDSARHREDIVRQLIQYAQACAAWLEADLREARAHNHGPSPEQQSDLDGYRFTAAFLEESGVTTGNALLMAAMAALPLAVAAIALFVPVRAGAITSLVVGVPLGRSGCSRSSVNWRRVRGTRI